MRLPPVWGLYTIPRLNQVVRYSAKQPRKQGESPEQHFRRCIREWVRANRKIYEHFFRIDAADRPESNIDIHLDALKLIREWNYFSSKPNRQVARYPIPAGYAKTGTIQDKNSVLRSIEDWIVREGDGWYDKWMNALAI